MSERNDIPRPGPASDDGAGIDDDDCIIGSRGERVPCPQCLGHGWLLLPFGATVDCPLCRASGWVSDLLASQLQRQSI